MAENAPPRERGEAASNLAGDSAAAAPARATEERCGPVAIARHVKDDGRSLLIYTLIGERERPRADAS